MEVGVRAFRDEVRRWIDAVERGEEVVITERGRPVVRLIKACAQRPLDRLIAEGLVRPAERPKRPSSSYRRVKAKGGSISDLVIAQRR